MESYGERKMDVFAVSGNPLKVWEEMWFGLVRAIMLGMEKR